MATKQEKRDAANYANGAINNLKGALIAACDEIDGKLAQKTVERLESIVGQLEDYQHRHLAKYLD